MFVQKYKPICKVCLLLSCYYYAYAELSVDVL